MLDVPSTEGRTHINAYSQSTLPLGRLLSNFSLTPFMCEDGAFASMEAYWYWLGVQDSQLREQLRGLSGSEAKKIGRKLRKVGSRTLPDFEERLKRAAVIKTLVTPQLRDLLRDSGNLRIVHYYVIPSTQKVVATPGSDWLWTYYQTIRTQLKEGNL